MEKLIQAMIKEQMNGVIKEMIKDQIKDQIKELLSGEAGDQEPIKEAIKKNKNLEYLADRQARRMEKTKEILKSPYISKNVGAEYYTEEIIYTALEFLDREISEKTAINRLNMTRYDFMKIWHCIAFRYLYPTSRTLYPHILGRV